MIKSTTQILPYFVLFALLIGCRKEERPVPKPDSGDVIARQVEMGADYKWQIYFDLKTNTVVGQNIKTTWDLGFEASADGYHIILNSAKSMFAYNTLNTNFGAVTDTLGFALNKTWDEASGNLDSTAIGDWRNLNHVYLIDRGYSETGTHQGYRKLQIAAVSPQSYSIKYANVDGTNENNLTINKDSLYNCTFLSFTTNATLIVEPPKATWDLVFTQYTHIFTHPDVVPYLVTGCLTNRYQTLSLLNQTHSFENTNLTNATTLSLGSAINTIGYDWKTFVGSVFETNSNLNYVIQDAEGYYYKLKFIDFYTTQGVKGSPRFEFQML